MRTWRNALIGVGAGFGGTADAAWSPLDLSGIEMFLRSDLDITLNGSYVSAWDDQTANGHDATQATEAAQPVYSASGGVNNLPYLTGTAAKALEVAVDFPEGAKTIWWVIDFTTDPTPDTFYSPITTKSATPLFCENLVGDYTGYDPYLARFDFVAADANARGIDDVVTTGVHWLVIRNGSGSITSFHLDSTNKSHAETGPVGRSATDKASILGRVDTSGTVTFGTVGRIYEIGVVDGEISAGDLASLQSYLAARYS